MVEKPISIPLPNPRKDVIPVEYLLFYYILQYMYHNFFPILKCTVNVGLPDWYSIS